jgi:hypothetical protein
MIDGMRLLGLLLLVLPAAAEGPSRAEAETEIVAAMRAFYGTIGSQSDGTMPEIRDKLIANLPHVGEKMAKSVRDQLDKAFAAKYKKSDAYHKCLAQVIASNGSRGVNKLYNRYKKLAQSHSTRLVIVEALGECGDVVALTVLRKMIHDNQPDVAAAAINGCAQFATKTKEAKAATMRELIDLYTRVTAKAQGKDKESAERVRYETLKPVLDKALNAYSEGEKLDSAEAWDAWLREFMTRKS